MIAGLEDLDEGGPGQLADGTPLPPSVVGRLRYDSELHRLLMAGGSSVLDYGWATRTVSQALWAALVARDGHCRHPGCDRPPSWCEGHHIVHFSKGAPKKLSNVVMACSRHHHLWHAQGWKLVLRPDATLDLVSPAGALFTTKPAPRKLRM